MARRILSIDDSLTIRKLLEMVLVPAGFDLELATSGTDGINRAKRRPPELILLDYVLPDMKGIDVCNTLAQDERTANVPVVIMSAKSDDVRHQFKDISAVIDFISKPFTPPEVHHFVTNFFRSQPVVAAAAGQAGTEPGVPEFTIDQKEAVAKALYGKLRDRFAKIPEWGPGMGSQQAGLYYAKKILTPDLMKTLMAALYPVFKGIVGSAPVESPHDPAGAGALLVGQTSLLQIPNLLSLLGGHGKTGELLLEQSGRVTSLFLRKGEVILVTHNQPDEYIREMLVDFGATSSAERDAAWNEQKKSGKPLYVTLAEAGRIQTKDLPDALFQAGRRALLSCIEGGPGQFKWFDRHVLPSYASAYGRPHPLEQLKLERLRKVDDWTQVEMQVSSVDIVFVRAENFSKTLKQFEMNDTEKRVLTLVDGRNSVKQIIERSGVATFEVFHVLYRMIQVGLIRKSVARASALPTPAPEARPVMIADADVSGFQEPLAAKFRQRKSPIPVVSLNGESALVDRFLKDQPRMVVLNSATPGVDLEAAARQVRSTLEISDLPLVALLEWEDAGRADALAAAGFSSVLLKPILYEELDRLLAV